MEKPHVAMIATPPNEPTTSSTTNTSNDDPSKHSPNNSRTHASYLPRDIPYNETYENSIHNLLTNPSPPPSHHHGLPVDSNIDPSTLPTIHFPQLPLPLDDPLRIYPSPIPGLRLTHPHGYLEGGPGVSGPDNSSFAQDFIAHFRITDGTALREIKEREIAHYVDEARERMRERGEALAHNARVEKEIRTLMDQREMELKIETKMRVQASERRERREGKRRRRGVEREG